jgi:GDPmannose 4,6-dehydratase
MNDNEKLKYNLTMIKPDIIIHLASISSSQYAFNNPIETLYTNGLLTAQICNIIYENKWKTKLFNASSSEIYKGHGAYTVEEDDPFMFHTHPYSIAKIMGHSMVDFYRNTYQLPFSNGIIFTTESNKKKPVFLLNKVAHHIKKWNKGEKELLTVGNLDSYKNILHASDVAKAIKIITEQEEGDNYLICSSESHKILDLVLQLYKNGGIELEKKGNIFCDVKTEINVLQIENNQIGLDTKPINILGNPCKLKKLGWKQLVSVNDILLELL